ncbi:MAG: lipoate--protein ligase family protein, partial [Ignavibacteriales bacterium]|nr:lipoate--protein ligase family protein [Ignavibacteriales bacterium]
MKWYFIDSGANTGAYNMEFDMAITGACKTDEAVVRFYRWQPYCISLGKYQDEGSINKVLAEHDGIDTVLRPTGGRAVLHSEELTYSVVMHTDFENTPQFIYREINCALKEGLVLYHPAFGESALEHKQPDFRNTYKQSSGLACFAATAKNELKLDHRKLIGSAQRKIGNKILQHGSIICGSFHLKIAEYLNLPE